jgi:signal transduction histidine kinase
VVDVLRRTPDGARVSWDVTAPPDLRARVDPADLTEALGALLENAARHAATRVAVRVARRGGWVDVEVRDDGPGAPAARLAAMRLRGVRYDAGAPGDGLGLAIAGEIAEAAGGALRLENADPGLAATLELPAAGAAPSAQARRGDRSTG